ncbi:hypothetical protein TpMuguga_03g00377 [Theileria parva strain Muguga]|uniref:Exportin-1/Importin-beta-like domain-containing protein n=1 Tax=Theileria parva TaxID=5875 RepID=Q4MZA2_THEPA|nr:uncharacterized protein TpMuguga_03g00377 [Theileria parva strain Muguga]EAN31114.1 hypothetical protein TpMuguga_03g00377 [Theileria parva strain Muguga]|eukprot:XP_763397.1 hypothetical protein [Theileria parva strain Muguga]
MNLEKMLTSEILSAVFAAQEGNPKASQLLYGLVEKHDAGTYTSEELVNKLTYSSDLLFSLVSLSESLPNEFLITFLQKSTNTVTKEKYSEFINLLRFYGYTLLVKFVENNWQILPNSLKTQCKLHIQSLFSNYTVDTLNITNGTNMDTTMNNSAGITGVRNINPSCDENHISSPKNASKTTVLSEYSVLVNQKVSQYICTIAIREWPLEWNDLIPSIIGSLNGLFMCLGSDFKNNPQLLNENNTQLLSELSVFWGLIVEISAEIRECLDVTLLHKRRIQISNLLKSYVYDIFITIHRSIVLGMASNQQLSKLILSISRNLSSILDGFIFVTFDVDEFLLNNLNTENTSDVVQTVSNLCLDVSHKRIKHLNTVPEFDLTNESLYITKLERFLKNLVIISQKLSLQLDYGLNKSPTNQSPVNQPQINQSQVTVNVLQMCQGFRNLMEKNSNYILENVNPEVLRLVFNYIICRLVMHPSVEVSTCSLNACSLLLRRISSIKLKKGENISQKLTWLDHKKFLLVLFIRGLKLGNTLINPLLSQHNLFTRLSIMDPLINTVTSIPDILGEINNNSVMSMMDWIAKLTEYSVVDEEISVGQMKSFEARFAALRSSILHCCSLLAIINPDYMSEVLSIIGELLSNFSTELEAECSGYCCNYRKNEKILNYICDKYILFDGILFILESTIFRLRSNTIDLHNGNVNSGSGNSSVSWLSVDLYKNLTLSLSPYNSMARCDGVDSVDWIVKCNMVIMRLMELNLCKSHKYILDIRRLDSLSTLSILFLYNGQFIGVVIEFVVSKILFEVHSTISNLNKCALQCLVVFCKNCKHLLTPFVDVIVSKIHQCLLIVTNDSSKDLLIESLISLLTISSNGADGGSPVNGSSVNGIVSGIMNNYVNEFKVVYEKVCENGVNSENLYKYLFNDLEDDTNRKHLHRIINVLYSILRKINIGSDTSFSNNGGTGVRNSGEESHSSSPTNTMNSSVLEELYRMVVDILMSFVNFWKFDFFDKNMVRKAVLSPGKDEWLSLQGYNEALASEDNLELIVETVFPIPNTQNKLTIRAIRRYIYILRQSILKLLGTIIQYHSANTQYKTSLTSAQRDDVLEEYVIGIIEWIPVFYLYQIIKHTLSPCILNLKRIDVIITKLYQRIDHEFLSLKLFKSHNNSTSSSNGDVEEKIIQLYYLKVYACIDCSNEILSLILFLIKLYNNNTNGASTANSSVLGNAGTSIGVNNTVEEERLRSILLCLASSLLWPYGRIVSESLRILRIYSKVVPQLDVKLHSKYLYQLILYLNKHILVPREFNPIEISGGSTNGGPDSVKEFVNTICCLFESLVKCFPSSNIIQNEEVNVNELVKSELIFETLKLFTPFFGEQDCVIFVKYILMQKSIDSRSLLRNRINQILKINNYDFATQFNCSILEPKHSTNEEEEEDILGNDILYLLFE